MFDKFHYGVCYYPEHWDASRYESDIRRMRNCGFDLIRLGEGAWGYWEPREGQYQFDLFDHVIDLCADNGIRVILGTPTYCGPAWVSNNYPEVLRWNFDRMPMAHGSRRNFNYTSPKYMELSDRLCTALADHYKANRNVIGWQLDNEFNCHMDVSYAPSDTLAFRRWCKEKYKTLDALNAAWGTAFWSQQYDSWDQIDLPHPTPASPNPTQLLDESRFISDCVVRFGKRQADILRKANSKWQITHNALFGNVNGPELMSQLDFFSHDQYPLFNAEGAWWESARPLIQSRSFSFPFGILEQQSGPGGWGHFFLRTPRPGQMRLWAWQSIAHGAKFISYFRWRTCPYGAEQHWHGLVDQDDRDNRRIAEAKQLGSEARRLPAEFFDARPVKAVAILRDYDNDINDNRINTYTKDGHGEAGLWADECQRAHIPVDMVWPSGDFGEYKLIVAPHLRIVDNKLADKLTRFVRAGGTLVLAARSGVYDRNCHVVELPLPGLLTNLAGIEIEDWTTLPAKETREACMANGRSLSLGVFVERLKLIAAEPIAFWHGSDSLLGDAPAVTLNEVAKGRVLYIGGYCATAAVATMLDLIADAIALKPIAAAGPEVELIHRTNGKRSFLVLLNHSTSQQRIAGLPRSRNLLTKTNVAGELPLSGYEVSVLELTNSATSMASAASASRPKRRIKRQVP
jgi:beta-galactosidase